ncbi:MAG: hypothetical protein OEZ39_01325 [Gammaproteobacteria bacterium]|nr:hypothetical protein [Gammaproteobacteria bacterium]MDH5650493.1 hypothetical protein [Gammaproteobacteria bacterium]
MPALRAVHISRGNRYGCPVGTLCSELARLEHTSRAEANKCFALFRSWFVKQFNAPGCRADADELAMHVPAFSQGVATMVSVFGDEQFVRQEVNRMERRLDSLVPEE